MAILAQRLQERLADHIYTVAVFDAPTVAELAHYLRQHYAAVVARLFGADAAAGDGLGRPGPVDEAKVAALQSLVRPLSPRAALAPHGSKNRPAVFILSPPRSGSTLFRVMLAGHPRLFAPPELQLLNCNTLQERREIFGSERDNFWLNGAVRALMEIKGYDSDQAGARMKEYERRGLTVQEFYRLMQDALGDRTIVDKTPFYALHPTMLARAEEDFQDARYLYLVRRPNAMISSFEEAKLHLFFPVFLTGAHSWTARSWPNWFGL